MAETFIQALGFRKLLGVSFGLFASLFLLWSLFNSSSFIPEGLGEVYLFAFFGYGLVGVYVFGRQDLQSKLKDVTLLRSIPYFLVFSVGTFFLFSVLLGMVDPFPQTFMSALVGVPLYLQLSNALIFGVVETSFWQGYLDSKRGILFSMIVAGFFHMFIWDGTLLENFLGSALLFGGFSTVNFYAKRYFRNTGRSEKIAVALALIVTIAVHVGYNLAKYRLIFGV